MDNKAYFISDLHLFCDRSIADQHVTEIRIAAQNAHTFILGGDIFDFKWSRIGAYDKSIAAARQWLEDFVHPFPDCQFHYLLGNHDCGPAFVEQLERLSQSASNLEWHPYFLRIGSTLFLHGDVTNRQTRQSDLERARQAWGHETPQGSFANAAYNSIVSLKLHRVAAKLTNPVLTVVQRLVFYLNDIGHGPASGVTDVYFGHTHLVVNNFLHAGIRFHNGGAPIKGLSFRILSPDIRHPEHDGTSVKGDN